MKRALWAGGVGIVVLLLLAGGGLWMWGRTPPPPLQAGSIRFERVEVPPQLDGEALAQLLAAHQLVPSASLARWYRVLLLPVLQVDPGSHWLPKGQSPAAVFMAIGRRRGRPVARVVVPEGWDSFQIARRLADAGVCDERAFLDAAHPPSSASGVVSAEGYLYPATYEFRVNTPPQVVVSRLEREARKRFDPIFEKHNPELQRLGRELGLHANDIVVLASIVEKEAADPAEHRQIASVFLNRLRDPNFRPPKMLQSDPTAAYGCKLNPELVTCRSYAGRVTSAMLRDASNAYNTYKFPGLPPSAIGNPSTAAVEAVLTAPATPYYFFVSPNGGRHEFSRTLDEHRSHLR